MQDLILWRKQASLPPPDSKSYLKCIEKYSLLPSLLSTPFSYHANVFP